MIIFNKYFFNYHCIYRIYFINPYLIYFLKINSYKKVIFNAN